MKAKLRIGVLGARRGVSLAWGARANGLEVAALCDNNAELLEASRRDLGGDCQTFTDFAAMLASPIDAVVLANYATEHVPVAKQALAAGKHVLSECMACFTMAEAVELVEAVEASGKIYMLAENYPFFVQNIEMKRLFETGVYGKFVYGEGEYVHPISAKEIARLHSGPGHWRTWLPSTYYCTHSMGPVMNITSTRPISVNGFVMPYDYDDPQKTNSIRLGDSGSMLVCRMDNEALVKLLPWTAMRDHGQRYRICCNKGIMEWNQGDGRLRIHTEPYDQPDAPFHNQWYTPSFPAEHAEALRHGHGGGDYFVSYYFARAIDTGVIEPRLDVYNGVDMTTIGIQGYRSALANGAPLEIPDFRCKEVRDRYREDHWNPDPARPCDNKPLPSVRGKIEVSDDAMRFFRKERDAFEAEIRAKAEKGGKA